MTSHTLANRAACLGLAVLMLCPIVALCQSSNGSVRGEIRDQSKAVIPGVNVILTNTATNVKMTTVTNNAGLYVFPSVIPGPYAIAVDAAGMGTFEATLTVRVQESTAVDVTLLPKQITTVVEVHDVTPVVKTGDADLGHTVDQQRISQMPINGRDVTNLLATVPGMDVARADGTSTTLAAAGGDANSMGMNGGRAYGLRVGAKDLVLDGSPLTEAEWGTFVTRLPGLESIEQFNVVANADSAKFTRPTSIILTTKSGTNQWHGSLFETNRNASIGLARSRQNYTTSPAPYVRNEYGGSFGGPVYLPKLYNGKNRSFFFVSCEGRRIRQSKYNGYSVPTEAMRNGDFSQVKTAAGGKIDIYNPFTTNTTTLKRDQFNFGGTLNKIDPSLQSPLAKNIYSILPLPTLPSVNPLATPNYYGISPTINNEDTLAIRFDEHIGLKDTFYIRMSRSTFTNTANSLGVPTLDKIANFRTLISPNKSLVIHENHVFSPTFINEIMLSGTRMLNSFSTGEPGFNYASQFGLPNPMGQAGYPVLADLGVGGWGSYYAIQSTSGTWYKLAYFVLEDNATKVKGRHEFQFGTHLRYEQQNIMPGQSQAGGFLSFPSVATGLYDPAVPDRSRGALNTGYIGASFYLGLASYQYPVPKGNLYLRAHEDAFYFQDKFRVSPRLTLNLGIRWQFTPFPKDIHNMYTGFDTTNMAIVTPTSLDDFYKFGMTTPSYVQMLKNMGAKFETAQQAGMPPRLINNNWHDVSPHLGFAYQALSGRKAFVLRGGMSLNYFPLPQFLWGDYFKSNAPFNGRYTSDPLTLASQSPDGKQNYGLINVPTVIAGKNSSGVIDLSNPNSVTAGSSNFQANYFNPNQPTSRIWDWNLTIEKELMRDTVMHLAYVGNRSVNQELFNSINAAINQYPWVWYTRTHQPYPTGTYASAAVRPLNVQSNGTVLPYGEIREFTRNGWSSANGAQVEVERRLSKGMGFQVFYNLMNVIRAGGAGYPSYSILLPPTSYGPGEVSTDLTQRQDQLLRQRDATIPKQQISFNWHAQLPFGRGKTFGSGMNKWLDAVVGGWEISGMGYWFSNFFQIPTTNYPTGAPIEYYGHKYPVQDCTSGTCIPGYLLWNAYIPAHYINSLNASGKPNGIMGVPANYQPAEAPLWPYPSNYLSLSAATDPNYKYYGTNTVFFQLNNGTTTSAAYHPLHPFTNMFLASTNIWSFDASIGKNFKLGERAKLRLQMDVFNAPNVPGNSPTPGGYGIAYTNTSYNTPRQLQLSGRLAW